MAMLETLTRVNEWWETGTVPQELAPATRRELFVHLTESLADRRITAIVGPRRTGKSTLMFQLMDMLIRERGIDPKKILFFSCDDVELRERKDLIGEAIRQYFEDFLKQDYRDRTCYVFIDEIHWIKDWQVWLKKFYDLKYSIKFIISGSSPAKIKREQKESLAGRISEYILHPMTFREFLSFNGININCRFSLTDLSADNIKKATKEIGPKKSLEIRKLFDEYLLTGGLPEWFETKNLVRWQKKLREDVLKRVIYDDIATLYTVKNASNLEKMLRLLSSLQSRTYSYNSLAAALNIDNETAGQYVSYLKESYIIFELTNYATSLEKQFRKNYKFVIFDTGIRNALERVNSLKHADTGYIVEGAVQQHMLWDAQTDRYEVYYWREKEEVDIVLRIGGKLYPIEVKYKPTVTANDLPGLRKFIGRYKTSTAMVVTKDSFETKTIDSRDVLFVPAWLLLAIV